MAESAFALVMEDVVSDIPEAVKMIEHEITMYVKIIDLQDIRELADRHETHEQWNCKIDDENTRMRIRMVDEVQFEVTTKEKTKDEMKVVETTQLISKSFFNALKKLSKDGYQKTRYDIPIEGKESKWEIDVFKKHSGEPSLWVKVDYEFKDKIRKVPELPFDYEELIVPGVQEGCEDEIKDLWEKEWMKLDYEKET